MMIEAACTIALWVKNGDCQQDVLRKFSTFYRNMKDICFDMSQMKDQKKLCNSMRPVEKKTLTEKIFVDRLGDD